MQEDSLAEAERKLQYYANEQGDDAALDNVTREIGIQSGMFKDAADAERFRFHFKAGFAGVPLVGTAPMIVEQMQRWSDLGVDGLNLTWLDYRSGLARFVDEVMPLMEQAGQRQAATSTLVAPAQVLA